MLWKYTIQHLKKHKKQTSLFLIFVMALISMMFVANVFTAYKKTLKNIANEKANGIWQIIFYDFEDIEGIQESPHLLEDVVGYDSEEKKIVYLDGDYETLLAYHLSEGRMPQTKDEIVMSKYRLKELGIEPVLNTIVDLDFGSYQLVGITDYIETFANKKIYPPYIVCPQAYESINVYLGGQSDLKLISKYLYQHEHEFQPGYATYIMGEWFITDNLVSLRTDVYYLGQIVVISSISFILILNYTYLNISNRSHDYVLLRGIGALKRQLYGMAFFESNLLFFIALPMSLLITYGVASSLCLNHQELQPSMLLSFGPLTLNGIIAYIIVLSANYLPVSRAISRALTGEFNQEEEVLIQKAKRKVRRLTPLTLSKIQLLSHKRHIIFLLVILISMTATVFYGIDLHLDTKKMNQDVDEYLKHPYFTQEQFSSFSKEELQDEGLTYMAFDSYRTDILHEPFIQTDFPISDLRIIPLTKEAINMLGDFDIVGRLPEKSHEVIVFTVKRNPRMENEILMLNKDAFTINEHYYKVVGQAIPMKYYGESNVYGGVDYLLPLSYSYMIWVFVSPEIIDENFEKEETISIYQSHDKSIKNPKLERAINESLDIFEYSKQEAVLKENQKLFTVICALVGLFLMYFFSLTQRKNQIQDYIYNLKRIGFTKIEILKIYAWESFMVNLTGILGALSIAKFSFKLAMSPLIFLVTLLMLLVLFSVYLVPVGNAICIKNQNLYQSF